MEGEHRREAKARMIALMQAGCAWREAAARVGVQISRSAAYRLLHEFRRRGEVAFHDGRHGHPAKLREPVRQWLKDYCQAAPHTASHEVQTALQDRFGIVVSIGHLNRMRATWGVGSRIAHREKNFAPLVQ